jgi:hypothetical protein
MISVLTPRMEAALDRMEHTELEQILCAAESNDDAQVWQMLCNKDMAIIFDNESLHQLLSNSHIQWGDLMMMMPMQSQSKQSKQYVKEYQAVDPDADWVMPILRLRKDIWENFPVTVAPIESKDKRERYSIQWHRKKFDEARYSCEHGWEIMDFEDDTYRRLIKALNNSRYWNVEEAHNEQDLCVIAMNFQDDDATIKPAKTFTLPTHKDNDSDDESVISGASEGWEKVTAKVITKKPITPKVPVLRRLNDIKTYFPVIWNEVSGCSSTTYAVEIFGKKVKEQGLNINTVKTDLLTALKASSNWTVLPAKNERHVCMLQMNHI